jgi:hypothetical protein
MTTHNYISDFIKLSNTLKLKLVATKLHMFTNPLRLQEQGGAASISFPTMVTRGLYRTSKKWLYPLSSSDNLQMQKKQFCVSNFTEMFDRHN